MPILQTKKFKKWSMKSDTEKGISENSYRYQLMDILPYWKNSKRLEGYMPR
jgi:hypothetical protein